MAGYNFKKFFDKNKIANSEWVSNSHFAIKRLTLKKSHNTFVDTFPNGNLRAESISKIVKDSISKFYDYYSKDDTEFIPTLYNKEGFKDSDGKMFPAIIDKNNMAINEEYYNFIKALRCKLVYNTEQNTYRPFMVFNEDSEIVGIVLPVRIDHEKILKAIDYNTYLDKLAIEKEQAKEAKQNNKKCLYISNNKAVIRKKDLTCIAKLVNDESYKNLYVEETEKDHGEIYIDLGIVFMGTGRTIDKNRDDASYTRQSLQNLRDITLSSYKEYITDCLNNNQFINVAEIKLMELAEESPEYIQTLTDHRQKVIDLREQESQKREAKREAEEQAYVTEQNNKAETIIESSEQAIINNQSVKNIEIIIYKSRYSNNTTSLILYLMKKYNINVPMKTQGWINQALTEVYYDNEYGLSYKYFTSSADSTVFIKYLKELVEKVENSQLAKV